MRVWRGDSTIETIRMIKRRMNMGGRGFNDRNDTNDIKENEHGGKRDVDLRFGTTKKSGLTVAYRL